MIQRTSMIDNKTGEIYSSKDKSFAIYDPNKGYLFRAKNFNVKQFADVKLSTILADKMDFMRCHLLAEYIYKDTNTIAIKRGKVMAMADFDDICHILDGHPKNVKSFINRLQKLSIIAIRTDMVGDTIQVKYIFNPLFFCSSKYLHADLYFLFQESLDKYIPSYARQLFHDACNIKK